MVVHMLTVHVSVCTCEANLLKAEQIEDGTVQCELPAVLPVHGTPEAHQLLPTLARMATLNLVGWKLMERPLPRAADPDILTPCHSTKQVTHHTPANVTYDF